MKVILYVFRAKATHQIAEASRERNEQLKAAFGLSEFFKDGSSMDPQRKAKEEAAKALAQKKYALVKLNMQTALSRYLMPFHYLFYMRICLHST